MAGDSDHDSSRDDASNASVGGEGSPPPPVPAIPVDNSSVPKPKRLACMICRKRKLKCDGIRPSCSTCSRLGHTCAYDEQRRKSGPKRGYVKALEERLKQVETMLKSQDQPNSNNTATNNSAVGLGLSGNRNGQNGTAQNLAGVTGGGGSMGIVNGGDDNWNANSDSPQPGNGIDDFNFNANMTMPMNSAGGNFSWEMIGLGLEEPMPPQETIDDLHQIYFDKVHPSMPMIHKYRYLAAMNLAPAQRPPVCLRYAMWTLACCLTQKYTDLKDLFYHRARKYVEADYVKGYGEHMISVAHCQTHVLLSAYEIRMMYFPRAWMSTGAAVRMAQMIGLHRLDGAGLDVKQCLPPPKDWTEREERRRTFWMAFAEDRYASIGTGWPMTVDERDIMTNLPASEEAFDLGRPEETQTLQECMGPAGAGKLTAFGGVVLLACLFGRNLVHLHRPDADEQDHDLNGPFWKRHRQMDNIILNTSLSLPSSLKLPAGLSNPNVVFTNMSIHTSTICLHQAAIFKAEKNKLPASVSSESKVRCITAANEIASIMKTISHMDVSAMNPFISFCLYVAARVFVQYLKSRPDDSQTADSLRFLLHAMHALKKRNPLSESFLTQLDVDFEALVLRIPRLRNAFPRPGDSPGFNSGSGNNGALCDNPENVQGIMAYRNDCNFLKAKGDDGNLAFAPEIVEAEDTEKGNAAGSNPGQNNGTTYPDGSWLSGDHTIRILTPSSGSTFRNGSGSGAMSGFGSNANGESQDGVVEMDEGQSNSGPTPNSSTGGGSDSRNRLGTGQIGGTGNNNPFQASPVGPQQNMMDPISGASNQAMFSDPNSFPMATNSMTGGHEFFALTNGWVDDAMSGQPNMAAAGGEGVLRALLNMGPMDAMDLSSWDASQENMR